MGEHWETHRNAAWVCTRKAFCRWGRHSPVFSGQVILSDDCRKVVAAVGEGGLKRQETRKDREVS